MRSKIPTVKEWSSQCQKTSLPWAFGWIYQHARSTQVTMSESATCGDLTSCSNGKHQLSIIIQYFPFFFTYYVIQHCCFYTKNEWDKNVKNRLTMISKSTTAKSMVACSCQNYAVLCSSKCFSCMLRLWFAVYFQSLSHVPH